MSLRSSGLQANSPPRSRGRSAPRLAVVTPQRRGAERRVGALVDAVSCDHGSVPAGTLRLPALHHGFSVRGTVLPYREPRQSLFRVGFRTTPSPQPLLARSRSRQLSPPLPSFRAASGAFPRKRTIIGRAP